MTGIVAWLMGKDTLPESSEDKLKSMEEKATELEALAEVKLKEAELKKRINDAKAKIARAQGQGVSTGGILGGFNIASLKKGALALVAIAIFITIAIKTCG